VCIHNINGSSNNLPCYPANRKQTQENRQVDRDSRSHNTITELPQFYNSYKQTTLGRCYAAVLTHAGSCSSVQCPSIHPVWISYNWHSKLV